VPTLHLDDAVLGRLRPRALHRAEEGRTLKADEAAALLTSTGEDLARLLAVASGVRDRAPWYADGGWGRTADGTRTVTYSRKVFVPLTHLCRDTCGYCTFAWPPKGDVPAFMSPEEVLEVARAGQQAGCKELLFTLGTSRRSATRRRGRGWTHGGTTRRSATCGRCRSR
jgi:FO synthase